VEVELHPGYELFPDVGESLGQGYLQMSGAAGFDLLAIDLRWMVTLAPLLFDDSDHIIRFMESPTVKTWMADMEETSKVKILMTMQGMGVELFSTFNVTTLEDMAGAKLRVYAGMEDVATALGAYPNVVDTGDVSTAVQTGMIDSLIGAGTKEGVISMNIIPTMKYCTVPQLVAGPIMLAVSAEFWAGLPTDIRTAMEAVIPGWVTEFREKAASRYQVYMDWLATEMTVTTLSAAEVDRWRGVLTPVWDAWAGYTADLSPSGTDIIAAANATRVP